jgi:hypothetical protein
LVAFFADSLRSITTDQAEINMKSYRNKYIPKQVSANTSENLKLDTKENWKILPHHILNSSNANKTISSHKPPDQHYPLTTSPDASGSALDFLWAAACAEAVQNPAGGIVPDQGSSECVDRADPLDVDWVHGLRRASGGLFRISTPPVQIHREVSLRI